MKHEQNLLTFSEMACLKIICRNKILKELRSKILLEICFDVNIQHENKSIFYICEIRTLLKQSIFISDLLEWHSFVPS